MSTLEMVAHREQAVRSLAKEKIQIQSSKYG
jgi:hypothetical protein